MKSFFVRFFVIQSICLMLFGAGAHSLRADVLSPNELQIEPATLPDGVAGDFVSYPISVTGGMGIISLTASGGVLPPLLRIERAVLDPAHFVLGYALTTPGAFTFTLTAQDQMGQTASREYSVRVAPAQTLRASLLVSSGDHTCVINLAVGWCWGLNSYGQLGNTLTQNNPYPVASGSDGMLVKDFDSAAGYEHTCTQFMRDGQGTGVSCVGRNQFGQLDAPYHYGGMEMVARLNHTCGISNGALDCWGWNAYGQLGNGTYTNTNEYSITQVAGLTSGVQKAALGDFHTCALVNGAAQCWGRNDHGQLGVGAMGGTTNSPAPVMGLPSGLASIAAGTSHTCAITQQGEAWCWGNNDHGQLGDGTTTARAAPAPVMGLGGRALSMAAGKEHTCALLEDGKVKCWGGGERGQLGNGAWADSLAPVLVQLPAGFRVAQIASGGSHMCARSLGGNVSCWGWNYAGQLGNGTFDDANTPIPVYGMATNIDLPRRLYLPLAFHSRP